MIHKYHLNGNEYQVSILETNEVDYTFLINGVKMNATLMMNEEAPSCLIKTNIQPPPEIIAEIQASTPAGESQKPSFITGKATSLISSPLPGIVRSILVNIGDKVKMNDKVLVLEAMKMDNTIFSEHEGTVLSIKAASGQAVLEGDILIELTD